MKTLIRTILIFLCLAPAFAADAVKLRTTGQSPADNPDARTSAIEQALRQAVEYAGVNIASVSKMQDYQLIADAIYASTAGLVENYEIIEENPNQDGLYTVRVESVVSRTEIDTKLQALKTLIKRKGSPRLMVVGSVDKQPFERRLTAELQGLLEKKGVTVIDLEMLEENKLTAAERASQGDLDPLRAALISKEAGADYFISVQVEGTKHAPAKFHGITLYTVDATAILKIIAADTARVIASEVVNASTKGQTAEQAQLSVTSTVTTAAMQKALGRLALNWLDDLDERVGAELTITATAFSHARTEKLLKALGEHPSVKEIILDSADHQGRTSFRLITNDQPVNLATTLKKIDPAIKIETIAKNSIQIYATGPSNTLISPVNLLLIAALIIALAIIAAMKITSARKS